MKKEGTSRSARRREGKDILEWIGKFRSQAFPGRNDAKRAEIVLLASFAGGAKGAAALRVAFVDDLAGWRGVVHAAVLGDEKF